MVKLIESKIQHKHQHEILSTFMKITRVNKFKNKTKFNKIQHKHHQCYVVYLRVNSGAADIHFFPVLHSTIVWSANGDAPFQGKFQVNLLNDDTFRWNCVTSSYGLIE